MIGEPLWVDDITVNWGRTEFARICVRIDFTKKLRNGLWIDDGNRRFFQPIAYEGLSQVCFKCGIVGHQESSCPSLGKAVSPASGSSVVTPSSDMGGTSGVVGGAPETCPSKLSPSLSRPPPDVPPHCPPVDDRVGVNACSPVDPGYGPWIFVTHKRPSHRGKVGPRVPGGIGNGVSKTIPRPVKPFYKPTGRVIPEGFSGNLGEGAVSGVVEEVLGDKLPVACEANDLPAPMVASASSKVPPVVFASTPSDGTRGGKFKKPPVKAHNPLVFGNSYASRRSDDASLVDLSCGSSRKRKKGGPIVSSGGDASPIVDQ